VTRRKADLKGNDGYSQADLGRMAAERSAINHGTLDTHAFVLDWAAGVRSRHLCGRCGQPKDRPIHEHAAPPVKKHGPPVIPHRSRAIKRYGDQL
jgi:hypothetical protein